MKKHVLFIVENNPVPMDVRVWNEAIAAKEFGYDVSVISPKSTKARSSYEKLDGISIYRHIRLVEADKKMSFLIEYGNALLWEYLLAMKIFLKKPFHYIHAANPPDHIFIIALFFKILGVKFIFDHHDICPENYVAKFNRKDLFYKMLLLMEKLTFKTANVIISTNESYKKIAVERGKVNMKKIFVVRNGPNLSRVDFMRPNKKWKKGFEYLVCYAGVIGNQEGIDNLLDAARYIVYDKGVKDVKFIVIGTGTYWNSLVKLSEDMGLNKYVQFTGFIPYKDYYEIIATSDVCVNPEHRNEFTDRSTMIKIMDYMTFGKPIVMFETIEGRVTAGGTACYLEDNDNTKFAEAILDLLYDKEKRKKMSTVAWKRVDKKLKWDLQKLNMKKTYEYLG